MLGNNIIAKQSRLVEVSDHGSPPPALEACRNLDGISCLPDYETWTGDENGAYCQSYLE